MLDGIREIKIERGIERTDEKKRERGGKGY
jgi:hypothetical protein